MKYSQKFLAIGGFGNQAEFYLNGVKIADLSAPLTLATGANTITGTGTGTLSGVISGGSSTSLTYALDAGATLTIGGTNTYSGTTVIAGVSKDEPAYNQFLPATPTTSIVLANRQLAALTGLAAAKIGGAYVNAGVAMTATPYFFRVAGANKEVQLQVNDAGIAKVVKVTFSQIGADIVATVNYAKYGGILGSDADLAGWTSNVIATSAGGNGYGAASITLQTTAVGGTLAITNSAALGTANNATINSGGTLDLTALGYGTLPTYTLNAGGTVKRAALIDHFTGRFADYSAEGLSAGALVTWNDLSGNGRHLTIAGGVTVGTDDGKLAVLADGAAGSRAKRTGAAVNTSGRWVFIALNKQSAAGQNYGRAFGLSSAAGVGEWTQNTALYIARQTTTTTLDVGRLNGTFQVANYVNAVKSAHVLVCTDGVASLRRDGVVAGGGNLGNGGVLSIGCITYADTPVNNASGVNACRRFTLIDCGAGGNPADVAVKAEAILLWWDGMQANLPAGHAYKNAPPVATITSGGTVIN